MSNNNNTTTATQENKENITKRMSSIQQQLMALDSSPEAAKVTSYLNLYGALHSSPDENAKIDGKTAEDYLELFNKESEALGKKRVALETELQELMRANRGMGKEDLEASKKHMIQQSNVAAQEPVKDLTAFAHPELDKIRSELQKNPLPGGDTAAIDDGTGGQTPEPAKANKKA
jgi:hypothetical protein